MAQNTTSNNARHTVAGRASIPHLNGAYSVRPRTVNTLRKMGFGADIIEDSMRVLDDQIRSTGEGQVVMMDLRRNLFGPMAVVETSR